MSGRICVVHSLVESLWYSKSVYVNGQLVVRTGDLVHLSTQKP